MNEIITSIFGEYAPITYTDYIVVSNEGMSTVEPVERVPDGLAGVDMEYISGVVMFAIVLLSFLKMVGVLLK